MKDGEPPSQFLEEAKISGYEERFKVWDEIVEYAKEQEKRQIEESINRRRGKLRKRQQETRKQKCHRKKALLFRQGPTVRTIRNTKHYSQQ